MDKVSGKLRVAGVRLHLPRRCQIVTTAPTAATKRLGSCRTEGYALPNNVACYLSTMNVVRSNPVLPFAGSKA